MPHPIDYFAREVNPTNTAEFWPINSRIRRGDPWNPHYVAGALVPSVQSTDEAQNLYRVVPDPNPAPQPGASYKQSFSDAFVGTVQDESAYIQETITWVQRDAQELFLEKFAEMRAYVDKFYDDDARLTYNAQDYWVNINRGSLAFYNICDLGLRNKTIPAGKEIQVLIERISDNNILFPRADEGLWTEFTRMMYEDYGNRVNLAAAIAAQDAEALRDANQLDELAALNVEVKWSAPVAGSRLGPDTFNVSGDHTAELLRDVELELQQPSGWKWCRVKEDATFDGSVTTVECFFINGGSIANESLTVVWDLYGYPLRRKWQPGDHATDPDQVPEP